MTVSDLELAQLLCTRLCHDLAGPIGAVAAGVELIGDDPAMADAETISLIGDSSAAASRKLKFMRAAMGATQGGGDLKVLLEGYVATTSGPTSRIEITWPTPPALEAAAQAFGPGWTQVLLNLCLLALEMQPGCRSLGVEIQTAPLTAIVQSRTANGRIPAMREDLKAAAAGIDDQALSAKTVQAYVAGRLVRAAGGTLSMSHSADGVTIAVALPQARP